MSTIRFAGWIGILLLLVSLSTAACIQPIAVEIADSGDEPQVVFDAFNAAVNAHDVDAALAYFAQDAVAKLPNQPPPNEFRGTSELRAWLETDAADNIRVAAEDSQVVGDTLTAITKVTVDSLPPEITLEGTAEVVVQQGKITSFAYTLSEQTLDALMALSEPTNSHVVNTSNFGQFNNIEYVKYEGRFISTEPGARYDAPFEIVAPKDPQQGNRRLLFEPYHFVGGAGSRDFLTPEFLFEQGFSHAAVCWETPLPDEHPCQNYEGEEGVDLQLITNFVRFLKGAEATEMVSSVEQLYSMGFSNSADPLHRLLLEPLGQNLFDLSFVLTTGWPHPIVEFELLPEVLEPLIPPETAGRVIVLQTEADLILWNGAVLREENIYPSYRLYEIAGAPHIPGEPLDWTPVLRAMFVAGDRWVTEGVEPPPSTFIATAKSKEIDPVYELETGIARNEDFNAQGGIRLPDLVLGSRQYIAVDIDGFPYVGLVNELKCEPRADGGARFSDHEAYVSQFQQELDRLVGEGFLLPADAEGMIKAASQSDIGQPNACP